jgi:hypothetical protein
VSADATEAVGVPIEPLPPEVATRLRELLDLGENADDSTIADAIAAMLAQLAEDRGRVALLEAEIAIAQAEPLWAGKAVPRA